MHYAVRYKTFLASLFFAATAVALAADITPLVNAAGAISSEWKPYSFTKIDNATQYKVAQDAAKGAVIHAQSDNAASALRFALDQSISAAPMLRWSWKTGTIPTGSSANAKDSDDMAARLYVTFLYEPEKASTFLRAQYGLAKARFGQYPPHSALCYIVEPNLPVGTIVDNPFTSRVKMIVVDNGKVPGEWRSFERDIAADYAKAFASTPPSVSGVVLMTDSDNTRSKAEAWYAAISLSKN